MINSLDLLDPLVPCGLLWNPCLRTVLSLARVTGLMVETQEDLKDLTFAWLIDGLKLRLKIPATDNFIMHAITFRHKNGFLGGNWPLCCFLKKSFNVGHWLKKKKITLHCLFFIPLSGFLFTLGKKITNSNILSSFMGLCIFWVVLSCVADHCPQVLHHFHCLAPIIHTEGSTFFSSVISLTFPPYFWI